MTHQEHQSPPLAQEANQDSLQEISLSSQEGFLTPDNEQLEMITGAGLTFSRESLLNQIEPKLVRTPSGKIAREREDLNRALKSVAEKYKDSNYSGQWVQAFRQPDGTHHLAISPEIQGKHNLAPIMYRID